MAQLVSIGGLMTPSPSAPSAGPDFTQQFLNANTTTLASMKAVLQASIAGTSLADFLLVGDSTTWGTGANNAAGGNKPNSFPVQMTTALVSASIPAAITGFIGAGSITAGIPTYNSYDSRVTSTGTWALGASTNGIGGTPFTSSANAAFVQFTPGGSGYDSIAFYNNNLTNPRTLSIVLDGVDSGVNFVPNLSVPALNANKQVVTGLTGFSQLRITNDQAAFISFNGCMCYRAADNNLLVMGAGRPGWKASDWAANTNGTDPLKGLAAFAPKMWAINLTINDIANATTISSYKTDLQTIITTLAATGPGFLVIGMPMSGADTAAQTPYWQAVYDLAVLNNLPVLNIFYYLGDYATANAAGRMYDASHENTSGYGIVGGAYKDMLILALNS